MSAVVSSLTGEKCQVDTLQMVERRTVSGVLQKEVMMFCLVFDGAAS